MESKRTVIALTECPKERVNNHKREISVCGNLKRKRNISIGGKALGGREFLLSKCLVYKTDKEGGR